MKKIILVFSLLLVFTMYTSDEVGALSCVGPYPPEEAIHKADIALITKVTDIKEGTKRTVQADVLHELKGFKGEHVTFYEDSSWGDKTMIVGRTYLLFLEKNGNRYDMPLCSSTKNITGTDIEALVVSLSEEVAKEETKEETKPVPTLTTEEPNDEPEKDTEKKSDWLLWLGVLTCMITATIVGIILVQTKKK